VLKEWQFNVLFFVGVGGAIFLVLAPVFGLDVGENPTALTGIGAILTYVLTQKAALTRSDRARKKRDKDKEDGDGGE